jgi:hypothetical protein
MTSASRRTAAARTWRSLVAFHPRFGEVASNFTLSVSDLLIGQAEVLGEVPGHLGHDLAGSTLASRVFPRLQAAAECQQKASGMRTQASSITLEPALTRRSLTHHCHLLASRCDRRDQLQMPPGRDLEIALIPTETRVPEFSGRRWQRDPVNHCATWES